MSCDNNAGRDGSLQIGIGATWGTAIAATNRLPIITEGLNAVLNQTEPGVLAGNIFGERMDIQSEKAEGDLNMLATPDGIPYLLYLAFGKEHKVIPGSVASTYKHYYTPYQSGGDLCHPFFTAQIDKVEEILIYDSLKANTLTLSATKEDYIQFTMGTVGREELDEQALTAGLALDTKNYFKFRNGTISGDVVDSDYTVSGTKTGKAAETCVTVATNLTGAAGLEIFVPILDEYDVLYVYEYVGAAIGRSGTTLTFADAPAGDDSIYSVTLATGVVDTANWNRCTEEYGDVESFEMSYENNMPADKFTSKEDGYLAEPNPQGRACTLSIGFYLNNTANELRKERYKKARPLSISFEFEVVDYITGTTRYEFALLFEKAFITEAPMNLDGPDELKMSMSLTTKDPIPNFFATATGVEDDTISTDAATTIFHNGNYLRCPDPDGYDCIYKYIGADVTAAASVITFKDAPAAAQIESVWLANDVFNDEGWEMADGVVGYVIDGTNDEHCYPRT